MYVKGGTIRSPGHRAATRHSPRRRTYLGDRAKAQEQQGGR